MRVKNATEILLLPALLVIGNVESVHSMDHGNFAVVVAVLVRLYHFVLVVDPICIEKENQSIISYHNFETYYIILVFR